MGVIGPRPLKCRPDEISDVLLDKDGHVTAVMLSVGGFLGLGAKYVSVPFNALRMTEKDGKRYLVMDTTKDALMSAPGLGVSSLSRALDFCSWHLADQRDGPP